MNNTLAVTLTAWRGKDPCVHKRISLFLQIQIRASDGVPKCCSVRESSISFYFSDSPCFIGYAHHAQSSAQEQSHPLALCCRAAQCCRGSTARKGIICIVLYCILFYSMEQGIHLPDFWKLDCSEENGFSHNGKGTCFSLCTSFEPPSAQATTIVFTALIHGQSLSWFGEEWQRYHDELLRLLPS